VRLSKSHPVDVGLEQKRGGLLLRDPHAAEAVHVEGEIAPGRGATRPDRRRQGFVSEAPLHEGCRNRVLRSGGVEALPGGERHRMGRLVGGDGKGPMDVALPVSHEKEEVRFQFFEDGLDPRELQA